MALCDLAKTLPLGAVMLDPGVVEFQRVAADVAAFKAGAPGCGAPALEAATSAATRWNSTTPGSNMTAPRGRVFARSQRAIAFPQPPSGACSTSKRPNYPRNQPERYHFALFQKGLQNPSRKLSRINSRIYPIRLFHKVR